MKSVLNQGARLLLALAILAVASAPAEAAELEDLVGDWTIMVQMPDAPQMANLKAEKNADGAVVATLKSPLGESAIDDIEVIDGKHVLLYMMDLGGQQMDIEVDAQVTGDTLAGKVVVNGGAMELPIEGARTGTESETTLKARVAELMAAASAPATNSGATTATAETATPPVPATSDETASAVEAAGQPATAAGAAAVASAQDQPSSTSAGAEPAAVEAAPVRLAVADAQDFMGDWILKVTTFRGDNYVDFKASDEDGFVLANFTLPPPMTVDPIRDIARNGGEFAMKFILHFGSSNINMTMKLHPEDGRYLGTLIDENNMFNSQVALLTKAQADAEKAEAAAKAEAAGEGGDGGGKDAEANRAITSLTFGDKKVSIDFSATQAKGEDFERVDTMKAGEIVRYTFDFATKLKTEIPLKFGDVDVPTDNAAPNYPGVYSLWLKKTDSGWALQSNNRPDIWGTQHKDEADGPLIPLAHEMKDEAAPTLSYELTQQGDNGGRLTIKWGGHVWTADFTVQP